MSYATTAQLREYLSQVATGATMDAQLTSILGRANAIVDEALGFSFAAYGVTATDKDVRGVGGEWLVPSAYKAASVTAITVVSARGEDDEDEEAVESYVVDEDVRPYRIWRGAGWTRDAWYRVTAIWGYGAAPNSIVEVEIEIAVNIWRSRDAANFGSSVGVDNTVGVNRALTWAQRSIIDGVRAKYLGAVHA